MKMTRTPALIAAIALSLYGSSAFSQAAAPPTAPPAHDAAATTDMALTEAIYSALDADPNHFFRHVTVEVHKGAATLGGFVNSTDSIYAAQTIARKVPGVSHVTNNVHLQPNRPR